MSDNNLSENIYLQNLDFISKPQFLALKDHFEKILARMKDDINLKETTAEFSYLLRVFQTCFRESERKTQKIFELRALNAAKSRALESSTSPHDAVADLKNVVENLQRDLDKASKERPELLKEVEKLKKTVDEQNKLIQDHRKSLKYIRGDVESVSDLTSDESNPCKAFDIKERSQRIGSFKEEHSNLKLQVKDDSDKFANLRSNLELLLLDLKVARKEIEQLKKEICDKDTLVSELSKDVSESEKMLTEAERRISYIRQPLETKVDKYRTELSVGKEKLQAVSEELEKARLLNNQLSVDISSKESITEDLRIKLGDLESANEFAVRNSEVFERHLGRSQAYNRELINENKTLKDEIEALKKQVSKEVFNEKLQSERERKDEIDSQEKAIESLKNHILLRDQKLRQTEQELSKTTEDLGNLRRDVRAIRKERTRLKTEITHLKRKLSDKISEVKNLKEKIYESREESGEVRRELKSAVRNHQQIVDKKNKYHSMYSRIKFVSSQQKTENAILVKRQEYLVKILKEKDVEIENLLTWRSVRRLNNQNRPHTQVANELQARLEKI